MDNLLENKVNKIVKTLNGWLSEQVCMTKSEANFPSYAIHMFKTLKGTRPFINYSSLSFLKPRQMVFIINDETKKITGLWFLTQDVYNDEHVVYLNKAIKKAINNSLVIEEVKELSSMELPMDTITQFEF